jgi:tetratricopeptide (TPR) repeat protein
MARKALIRGIVTSLLALAVTTAAAPPAWACGSPYYYADFAYELYPDYPLDGFAGGNLGVLNPRFARSYLYVAYRYLSGKSFDASERKALLRLWDERLNYQAKHDSQEDAVKFWMEARKAVPGSRPVSDYLSFAYAPGHEFDSFVNITPDAFHVAAETLGERIKTFGAKSRIVADWLAAQDMVFSNPGQQNSGEHARGRLGYALVPDLPDPGLPPVAKADRMHQRASAYFYAGCYDEAEQLYREISADSSSPWSATSKFMIARCLLRKATVRSELGVDEKQGALAEAELRGILARQDLKEFHASASRLSAYLAIRLHSEGRLGELAKALLHTGEGDALFQELWDYTILLDSYAEDEDVEEGWPLKVPKVSKQKDFEPRPAIAAKNDMTDWILTFQSKDPRALDYALKRWRRSGSLPWLVVCLTKMRKGRPGLYEVLRAAEKIPADSPGFFTVAFHRARLLADTGKRDKDREVVDTVLSRRSALARPSLNLFMAERMGLAQSLDEFLVYAAREPAAIIYWNADDTSLVPKPLEELKELEHYKKGERLMDTDGALVMNRDFPLDVLTAIAFSERADANIRRETAMCAWTRAVLLGRSDSGTRLAAVLGKLVPEINKGDLKAYVEAKGDEALKFAAVYILLKTPGLAPIMRTGLPREIPINRVGNYYRNAEWWCAKPSPMYGGKNEGRLTSALKLLYPDDKVPVPTFLSGDERAAGLKEWQTLSSLEDAPDLMGRQALAWAQGHPDDPRVPETLHLIVRAGQYGCGSRSMSDLSRKAFQMLHQRYPKSEWAAKTKFWYASP